MTDKCHCLLHLSSFANIGYHFHINHVLIYSLDFTFHFGCLFVYSKTTNEHLTWLSSLQHTVLFLSRFLSKEKHLLFPKRMKNSGVNLSNPDGYQILWSTNYFRLHTRLNIPELKLGVLQKKYVKNNELNSLCFNTKGSLDICSRTPSVP